MIPKRAHCRAVCVCTRRRAAVPTRFGDAPSPVNRTIEMRNCLFDMQRCFLPGMHTAMVTVKAMLHPAPHCHAHCTLQCCTLPPHCRPLEQMSVCCKFIGAA